MFQKDLPFRDFQQGGARLYDVKISIFFTEGVGLGAKGVEVV